MALKWAWPGQIFQRCAHSLPYACLLSDPSYAPAPIIMRLEKRTRDTPIASIFASYYIYTGDNRFLVKFKAVMNSELFLLIIYWMLVVARGELIISYKVKGSYFGHLRLIKGFCGQILANCYQFWTEYTLNINKYMTPQEFKKCTIGWTAGPIMVQTFCIQILDSWSSN